ncbi:transposase [Nonomuraea wenchangensis]|uniref:transposase n=1 Tax=Nonomuraea wenchangensis TaxID=568860 RepID=UPI00384C6722
MEACRALGIGRKTGYRWRAENGGLPPARLAESARSSRFLSLLERQRIATLRAQGLGVRAIADRLGRSPSTVSREPRRNTLPHDRGVYDGDLAHARARQRARRPRQGRLLADAHLRAEVQAKLELDWSPEQIAAYLRSAWPNQPSWHVCHETIYQALYHGGEGGLSRQPHPSAPHRPTAAQAPPPTRPASAAVHRVSAAHRPPVRRRRAPPSSRGPGGRPDHRSAEPVRDRHPRRPQKPLPALGPAARSSRRAGRSRWPDR